MVRKTMELYGQLKTSDTRLLLEPLALRVSLTSFSLTLETKRFGVDFPLCVRTLQRVRTLQTYMYITYVHYLTLHYVRTLPVRTLQTYLLCIIVFLYECQ